MNQDETTVSLILIEESSFWCTCIFLVLSVICWSIDFTPLFIRIVDVIISPIVFTYFTGKAVLQIVRYKRSESSGMLFNISSYSLIGLIVNSTVFSILGIFHLFSAPFVISYFVGLLSAYLVASRMRPIRKQKKIVIPLRSFKNLTGLVSTSFICLLVAMWILPVTSFPYFPGWDLYTNLLTVRTILNNSGISELNLQYLPTMHYFYAFISMLTGLDPFVLFWGSIYFLFPIGGAALFLFGSRMSNNILVGICTGIIGVTIGASDETLGLIFPFPSTIGLILTILANAILLKVNHKTFMVLYIISTILFYPYALFANIIFLVGIMFISNRKILVISVSISILSFVALLHLGGNYLASQGGTILSTDQIVSILKSSYAGEKGLLLVTLGLIFIFIDRSFNRRFALVIVYIAIMLLVMVSGTFIVGYRLEEFMRPFVALLGAYGLGSFSTYAGRFIHEQMIKKRNVSV